MPASRSPRPRACAGRFWGFLAVIAVIALLTVPEGAPLRDPVTGAIGGNSPFMSSLIVIIMLIFLVIGLAYGIAAGTIRNAADAIDAIVKTFAGLSGMIFLLLIISQFIAYFNYSNLATIAAVNLANLLQGRQSRHAGAARRLRRGGRHPRPDHHRRHPEMGDLRADLRALDDEAGRRSPEAVLAAYRIGDSPMNAITPLNVYFGMVVGFCQRYDKDSGVGTVVAMMLPYVGALFLIWIAAAGRLVPAGAAVRAVGGGHCAPASLPARPRTRAAA